MNINILGISDLKWTGMGEYNLIPALGPLITQEGGRRDQGKEGWHVPGALLIFLQAILIPACASSSPVFLMMYSVYKLNK